MTARQLHMSMTVDFARGIVMEYERGKLPQVFFALADGTPAPYADVYTYLDELKADGWRLMPMTECDNFDKTKGCLGHLLARELLR